MTDVEIISKLCEIDKLIRKMKRDTDILAVQVRASGITKLPPHLAKMAPGVIESARQLLAAKRELRLQLWKEYGIFYWSDV